MPDEGVEEFEPLAVAIKDRILAGSDIVESCLDVFLEREQALGRAPSGDTVRAQMNSLYDYSGLGGLLGTRNRYMDMQALALTLWVIDAQLQEGGRSGPEATARWVKLIQHSPSKYFRIPS